MIPRRLIVAAAWAALSCLAGLAGCLGDRCGPDQEYQDRACIPQAGDAGADADGSVVTDGEEAVVGEYCDDEDPSCPGERLVCVILPGETEGYCSVHGCSLDDDDCPDGYYCLDISAFTPEYGTICLKE